MAEYGLSLYDASTLIEARATADWYEAVVRGGRNRDPKIAAPWTLAALSGALNRPGPDLAHCPESAAAAAVPTSTARAGTVPGRMARGGVGGGSAGRLVWHGGRQKKKSRGA